MTTPNSEDHPVIDTGRLKSEMKFLVAKRRLIATIVDCNRPDFTFEMTGRLLGDDGPLILARIPITLIPWKGGGYVCDEDWENLADEVFCKITQYAKRRIEEDPAPEGAKNPVLNLYLGKRQMRPQAPSSCG